MVGHGCAFLGNRRSAGRVGKKPINLMKNDDRRSVQFTICGWTSRSAGESKARVSVAIRACSTSAHSTADDRIVSRSIDDRRRVRGLEALPLCEKPVRRGSWRRRRRRRDACTGWRGICATPWPAVRSWSTSLATGHPTSREGDREQRGRRRYSPCALFASVLQSARDGQEARDRAPGSGGATRRNADAITSRARSGAGLVSIRNGTALAEREVSIMDVDNAATEHRRVLPKIRGETCGAIVPVVARGVRRGLCGVAPTGTWLSSQDRVTPQTRVCDAPGREGGDSEGAATGARSAV